MLDIRPCLIGLALACMAAASSAQTGHLSVPGAQMVYSNFTPVSSLPQNQHYALGYTRPDGTQEPLNSSTLVKQTLVYTDFMLLIVRASTSNWANAETGEIYLADADGSQRNRPLQDQWPLARYSIPAGEGRALVHVTLAAGRAYSGYRQPALVSYINPNVTLNARALGYVMPN